MGNSPTDMVGDCSSTRTICLHYWNFFENEFVYYKVRCHKDAKAAQWDQKALVVSKSKGRSCKKCMSLTGFVCYVSKAFTIVRWKKQSNTLLLAVSTLYVLAEPSILADVMYLSSMFTS